VKLEFYLPQLTCFEVGNWNTKDYGLNGIRQPPNLICS